MTHNLNHLGKRIISSLALAPLFASSYNWPMIKEFIVGCVLVAAFTHCVQPVKTVKIHQNCPEIPATTFEKVGLDAKAGALQFGKLVTVGELTVKSDPQIISGISQSVRDDQVTDALVCAAKERGELKTDEQIDYAWKVARFFRTNPTPVNAMEFYKQFPFPVTSGKHLSQASQTPGISQYSGTSNSPNIVGNQNVVTFNPSSRLSEQEPTDQDDKKLYFECNIKPLPKTIPPGGLRAVMCGAHPPDPHSSYEILESGNPGDVNRLVKYGLGDNGSGGAGFMCQVTYYGKNPILKVDLPFALEFREVVGGNVKFVTARPARIRKLETNEKYDFFLFNASEYVLNISTPQYADVEPLGEYKSRRVKLSTPYSYDGTFGIQLAPVKSPSSAAK